MDTQPSTSASPWLHRFALLLSVLSLILVFAGGLVTSKGAGLSVPDWPLAYGSLNPPGWLHIENVRAEHGHRLLAGTVAFLTFILAVWVWRAESRLWVRRVAAGAFGLVLLQALFGGLTVLHFRPLPIVVTHAIIGQTFFCLIAAVALFTSGRWTAPAPSPIPDRAAVPLQYLVIGFLAVLYLQLTLGALMRHTESGLAIPDFPLSYGRFLPALDETSVHNANVDRDQLYHLPVVTAGQIAIHFSHRLGAILVSLAGLWVGIRILSHYSNQTALLVPALMAWCLILLQIILGVMTILSGKQPHLATAHQATGAALLATGWILVLETLRAVRTAPVTAEAGSGATGKRLGSKEAAT